MLLESTSLPPTATKHVNHEALSGPVPDLVRQVGEFRWENRPVLNYKEEGTHFKAISRQVLFPADAKLAAELRYFEILSGGHSTLEKHDHVHSVMILRGRGKVLVGEAVYEVNVNDLIHIPSLIWHQFRAVFDEPFGFLCLVNPDRDRPQRPTAEEAEELKSKPIVGQFVQF